MTIQRLLSSISFVSTLAAVVIACNAKDPLDKTASDATGEQSAYDRALDIARNPGKHATGGVITDQSNRRPDSTEGRMAVVVAPGLASNQVSLRLKPRPITGYTYSPAYHGVIKDGDTVLVLRLAPRGTSAGNYTFRVGKITYSRKVFDPCSRDEALIEKASGDQGWVFSQHLRFIDGM